MKQDPEKRNRWQQHTDALKASGKTRKKCCKTNQINSSTHGLLVSEAEPKSANKNASSAESVDWFC